MTRIQVQVEMDGAAIPGFPWIEERDFRHFFRLLNTVTNIATYTNALPSLDAGVTYRVSFFLVVADKACLVSVNDATPTEPIALAAGNLLLLGGANATHSNASPLVQIKATINPTNFLIVAGLR